MATTAIFGAGVMGETLLSGLLRSGREAADLVITEFRQQLRLEFRNQANRGRVSGDTVSLLRTRLADVRSEVLRELAQR